MCACAAFWWPCPGFTPSARASCWLRPASVQLLSCRLDRRVSSYLKPHCPLRAPAAHSPTVSWPGAPRPLICLQVSPPDSSSDCSSESRPGVPMRVWLAALTALQHWLSWPSSGTWGAGCLALASERWLRGRALLRLLAVTFGRGGEPAKPGAGARDSSFSSSVGASSDGVLQIQRDECD